MKEHFQDSTFSLLKALHHTKIAMEFYDDLANSYEYGAKQIMLQYSNKCKWIVDNIRHRLPKDMLHIIDKDMNDALFFDSIEDKLIHFNQEQRDMIESIIDLVSKGENIEVSYIEKATNNGG